jgi:hypothetical protein
MILVVVAPLLVVFVQAAIVFESNWHAHADKVISSPSDVGLASMSCDSQSACVWLIRNGELSFSSQDTNGKFNLGKLPTVNGTIVWSLRRSALFTGDVRMTIGGFVCVSLFEANATDKHLSLRRAHSRWSDGVGNLYTELLPFPLPPPNESFVNVFFLTWYDLYLNFSAAQTFFVFGVNNVSRSRDDTVHLTDKSVSSFEMSSGWASSWSIPRVVLYDSSFTPNATFINSFRAVPTTTTGGNTASPQTGMTTTTTPVPMTSQSGSAASQSGISSSSTGLTTTISATGPLTPSSSPPSMTLSTTTVVSSITVPVGLSTSTSASFSYIEETFTGGGLTSDSNSALNLSGQSNATGGTFDDSFPPSALVGVAVGGSALVILLIVVVAVVVCRRSNDPRSPHKPPRIAAGDRELTSARDSEPTQPPPRGAYGSFTSLVLPTGNQSNNATSSNSGLYGVAPAVSGHYMDARPLDGQQSSSYSVLTQEELGSSAELAANIVRQYSTVSLAEQPHNTYSALTQEEVG